LTGLTADQSGRPGEEEEDPTASKPFGRKI
jgi:hypothetical protein